MASIASEPSRPALTIEFLTDALRLRLNRDHGQGSVDKAIKELMSVLMGKEYDSTALNVAQVITQKNSWTVVLLDELYGIVGMGTLTTLWTMHGKEGRIDNLVILPGLERLGFGERLLTWLLEKANKESVHFTELTCERQRHNAHRLYKRVGFARRHADVYCL